MPQRRRIVMNQVIATAIIINIASWFPLANVAIIINTNKLAIFAGMKSTV